MPFAWVVITVPGSPRDERSWVADFLENELLLIDAVTPGPVWEVELFENFMPFVVLTLLIVGSRYLVAGKLSMRFAGDD